MLLAEQLLSGKIDFQQLHKFAGIVGLGEDACLGKLVLVFAATRVERKTGLSSGGIDLIARVEGFAEAMRRCGYSDFGQVKAIVETREILK